MCKPRPPQNKGRPLTIELPSGQTGYLNPYRYTYTTSRSYAQRMQRGYLRGLGQSEARGYRVRAGESETQRRRRVTMEQYGQTPWERYGIGFEATYGFKYSYWRKLRRLYLAELDQRVSPGARITPISVAMVKQAFDAGWHDETRPDADTWEVWTEQKISERLDDTIAFQDLGEKASGNYHFAMRSSVPPIEFWYYH
jgi:hypothetical protein